MTKQCSKCHCVRRLKFFNKDPRYRLGVKGWCKRCETAYSQTPYAKRKAKQRWLKYMAKPKNRAYERERSAKKYWRNPRKAKDQFLRRTFKVSLKLFERTKRCILCKRKVRLVADHNHETDKYRGALCHICNLMIAWFERIKSCKKIKNYLMRGV